MDLQITRTAEQLTVKFADDIDIPSRFKKKTNKTTKIKTDSLVEIRFKKHINAWTELINSILKETNDKEQAWRFITLRPQIKEKAIRLIDCKDYMDFLDYLIKRRDIENCDDNELGKLCMLQTAFQREVEKQIIKE